MQKKKWQKVKFKRTTKIFLIAIIILSLALVSLLLVQLQKNLHIENIFKEPELFVIRDECSLIFNNIIHEIKNEGECTIICKNECEMRDKIFHDSEFVKKEDSCHICNCYCTLKVFNFPR